MNKKVPAPEQTKKKDETSTIKKCLPFVSKLFEDSERGARSNKQEN